MLVLLCLIALGQMPLADRPMILDCASDSSASEFVFVTSQSGIRRLNRNTGTWDFLRAPGSRIGFLGVNRESLWVITSEGVSVAGIRQGRLRPCPIPGRVLALAFAGDRIWAGGDSGLLRFDPRAGAWRQRAGFAVNDMAYWNGRLWIASDAGAFRYDPGLDLVTGLPVREDAYRRIITTAGRIWFLSDRYLTVYRPDQDSAQAFAAIPVTGYSSAGDSLFAASRGAVYLYEPDSSRWVELGDSMPLRDVAAVSVEGGNVWCATGAGLSRYGFRENVRQAWTRKDGLAADSLLSLYADQRFVYAAGRRYVQVLDRKANTWKAVSLSGRRGFFDFLCPRH